MKNKDNIVKPDKKRKKEKIVKESKKTKKDKTNDINDDLIIAKDKSEIKTDQTKIQINQIDIKKETQDPNKQTKTNSEVDYKDEKKHKAKRLFFGLGKEFWRISWPTNKKILNDFITTIIVMTFFVLIFYGVGVLIAAFIK
ncbi:MAG: preprotein translocase subunit SecE [Mycoplasmoidaceae bacterium]